MLRPAYNDFYIDDAKENLGEAFDYVSSACRLDLDVFMGYFLASGVAEQFGIGNPRYVSGLSGTELVIETLSKTSPSVIPADPVCSVNLSPEYWCGYVLAYFQWKSGLSFKKIQSLIPASEILSLYHPLHEADESRVYEALTERIKEANTTTSLQKLRLAAGLSQRELSAQADVNLRTLQQYESRAKDINKASVTTVLNLAKALCCDVEDLLEITWPAVS